MNVRSNIIITGSSGFLGRQLVAFGREVLGGSAVLAVPGRNQGGPRLDDRGDLEAFIRQQAFPFGKATVLIHAAAEIAFQDLMPNLRNMRSILNGIESFDSLGLGRAVFISSVSALQKSSNLQSWCPDQEFDNLYGAAKASGELCFSHFLPQASVLNIRLGGVVGLQVEPGMFWNRLLAAAAAKTDSILRVGRLNSFRNYVTVHDAARAIIQSALSDLQGTHTLSAAEVLSTGDFLRALQKTCPKLVVEVCDDGKEDRVVYPASPALQSSVWPLLPQLPHLIGDL
jgi:nucleoside-diphosphate-sugar epimerase